MKDLTPEEKKEKALKMLKEYLKPLGALGRLSQLNDIDWDKMSNNKGIMFKKKKPGKNKGEENGAV